MNNSHDKFTQLKVGKNLSFSVLASYNNYGCCCPVAISNVWSQTVLSTIVSVMSRCDTVSIFICNFKHGNPCRM